LRAREVAEGPRGAQRLALGIELTDCLLVEGRRARIVAAEVVSVRGA
jgi:hypothetical protein